MSLYEMISEVNETNLDMNIPQHVAIIPDGNRRWAREHGLGVFDGHKTGAEKTLPDLIEHAHTLGIKYLTFWALSTENLTGRSQQEINGLLSIVKFFLQRRLDEFHKKEVKLKIIGNLEKLPQDIQEGIAAAIKKTENNNKITLTIALNYGGRDEIIRAIRKLSPEEVSTVTKESFDKNMDTNGVPAPDLIIRTGGEQRLSGFMLWQSEYSELYFSDLFFPDFTPSELEKAVNEFQERQRRFGK